MKKLFTAIACALCAGFVLAGDYFPVKLTVAASGTTATADIDMSTTFGAKAMFVERVTATCTSGNGTGVVTFAAIDHAVATTIATSTSLVTGSLYAGYPSRTVTTSTITDTPVVSTTNYTVSVVTTTNTVAASMPYLLKTVRVSVAQLAVAGATVYNAVIYVQ
jgi:hypothetical protein